MLSTNLTGYMQEVCQLVAAGYGSMQEVMSLDSPEFLDALEFEFITGQIKRHLTEPKR